VILRATNPSTARRTHYTVITRAMPAAELVETLMGELRDAAPQLAAAFV